MSTEDVAVISPTADKSAAGVLGWVISTAVRYLSPYKSDSLVKETSHVNGSDLSSDLSSECKNLLDPITKSQSSLLSREHSWEGMSVAAAPLLVLHKELRQETTEKSVVSDTEFESTRLANKYKKAEKQKQSLERQQIKPTAPFLLPQKWPTCSTDTTGNDMLEVLNRYIPSLAEQSFPAFERNTAAGRKKTTVEWQKYAANCRTQVHAAISEVNWDVYYRDIIPRIGSLHEILNSAEEYEVIHLHSFMSSNARTNSWAFQGSTDGHKELVLVSLWIATRSMRYALCSVPADHNCSVHSLFVSAKLNNIPLPKGVTDVTSLRIAIGREMWQSGKGPYLRLYDDTDLLWTELDEFYLRDLDWFDEETNNNIKKSKKRGGRMELIMTVRERYPDVDTKDATTVDHKNLVNEFKEHCEAMGRNPLLWIDDTGLRAACRVLNASIHTHAISSRRSDKPGATPFYVGGQNVTHPHNIRIELHDEHWYATCFI